MKLTRRVILSASIVVLAGVGGGVALANRGEEKPVEQSFTTEVQEVVEAESTVPVEETETFASVVEEQAVVEPEPEVPTAAENKAWFLGQVEANIKANPFLANSLTTEFLDVQNSCADRRVTAFGDFEDRAYLERTASLFVKGYFENKGSCRVIVTE